MPTVLHGPNVLPLLSHMDRRLLNWPVSIAEIRKALFDMDPNKKLRVQIVFHLLSFNIFGILSILLCGN